MNDQNVPEAGSLREPAFAVPESVPEDARLWIVRHGETEWSRSGRHTSRTDLDLTPAGERQAEGIAAVLGDLDCATVICSPRVRARETARIAGLPVDTVDDDLAEWDYGDYEGRTSADIRAERPGWELWRDGAPGGESPDQVAARADRVLARACANLVTGPVVLVGHGHISRMIAARWIGMSAEGGRHLLLSTAAPSLLGIQYGVPVIDRWNLPNPATTNGDAG